MGNSKEIRQNIIVERNDPLGQPKELWKGAPVEFKRRTRYLKTADVSASIEVDGELVRKIPLNVSQKFDQLLSSPREQTGGELK